MNPKAYGISVINTPGNTIKVNLLNVAGHCVSYNIIRRIDTSIAKKIVIDDLECN